MTTLELSSTFIVTGDKPGNVSTVNVLTETRIKKMTVRSNARPAAVSDSWTIALIFAIFSIAYSLNSNQLVGLEVISAKLCY